MIKDKLITNYDYTFEKINKNILENIAITTYDNEFRNNNSIVAKKANINNQVWVLEDVSKIDSFGKEKIFQALELKQTLTI